MQAVGCLLFAAFGITQLIAAWFGASYAVGPYWAVAIFAVCVLLRFTLPITIFSFVGMMYVWDWPWWGALLFNFPMLIVAIPSMLASVLEMIGAGRLKGR